MRISYVTPYDRSYTSIYKHTRARIEYWRAEGAQVDVHLMGPTGRRNRSAVLNLWHDFQGSSNLVTRVKNSQPDVILLRWLNPVPGLIKRLSGIAPVVLDIHTNDKRKISSGSVFRRYYLKAFRESELSRASGGVFITDELVDASTFAALKGPRGVFTNGSELERRKAVPLAAVPRAGMSIGGVFPWNGIDLFSQLAEKLPDVEFVIVAPEASRKELTGVAGDKLQLIFTNTHEEYLNEVTTWTVGFGTLALHRQGTKIGAPLKVRDYVALGIPTILPYFDQTLSQEEHSDDMVLNIPSEAETVENLDVSRISTFISDAQGQQVAPETSQLVSLNQIEDKRLEFLKKFLAKDI